MFILKIILGLILAIAVGAIFTDNMGDGYFDFQKKAKAEAPKNNGEVEIACFFDF